MTLKIKTRLLFISIFFLSLLVVGFGPVEAKEYHSNLVLSGKKKISKLKFDSSPETRNPLVEVRDPKNPGPHYYTTLKGRFTKKDRTLVYNNEEIETDEHGNFSMEVEVTSEKQKVTLLSIDDKGSVQKQKVEIDFPDWKEFEKEQHPVEVVPPPSPPSPIDQPVEEPKPKKFSITPALGYTIISYEQTYVSKLTETVITPKVSASYNLSKRWSIDANAFYNALLVSHAQSAHIEFLGINGKVGYTVPKLSNEHWILKLSAGYYFNTSFSHSQSFGYKNVNGPELFPMLTHLFPKEQAAWLYFKYSPIFNGLALLSLNNTEMGIGAGFSFAPSKKRRVLSITADIVVMKIQLVGVAVTANSYTFGVGYRF